MSKNQATLMDFSISGVYSQEESKQRSTTQEIENDWEFDDSLFFVEISSKTQKDFTPLFFQKKSLEENELKSIFFEKIKNFCKSCDKIGPNDHS